ncbi:MAG: chlorophyll synthase ChlG [Gemmatimonadaceae bacterium]
MLTVSTVEQRLRTGGRLQLGALLELLKPVTWFPPMWAFLCGAVSSGVPLSSQRGILLLGVLITGPMVCGSSQVVNDWFDREVDSLNEPNRPIPSGRVPGRLGLVFAILWTLLSLALATILGPLGFAATALALLSAWAYSAPPLRLKKNGWWGNLAVGLSYEGLAWICGAAVLVGGTTLPWPILATALFYSLGAHGIMTLNDFKSVKGDRVAGVRSLPVQLGEQRAAVVACIIMIVAQLVVIGIELRLGLQLQAAIVGALVVVQLLMMRRFLADVSGRALWYSALGVPVYVTGMMVSAFGLRTLGGA